MISKTSPRLVGRVMALLFLVTIITGVFAQGFVSNRLYVSNDAAATATNLLTHRGLYELSFSVFIIEMVSNIATTALWYVLLRPVNRTIALVAAFLDLSGGIMKTFARVFYIAPLFVLANSGSVFPGFTPQQLQSIALVLFKVNSQGTSLAVAFFGFSILLNGFLIFRSTFLPRWLGVLAMVSALGWLMFIYPPLGRSLFTFTALLSLLNAVVMILWLLIRGIDEQKWKEVAAADA
jgi:hypothetical protein